jgi:hypothetical protein
MTSTGATIMRLCLIWMAIFASHRTSLAAAPPTVTLLDMVGELSPRGSTESVPVFTDTKFAPGTSCALVYGATPRLQALPISSPSAPTAGAPTGRQLFQTAPWGISTWVTNQAYPNLCAGSVVAEIGEGLALSSKPAAPDETAYAVRLQRKSVTLSINSRPFWRTAYAAETPVFRGRTDLAIGWPNLLVSKTMHPQQRDLIWLNDIGPSGQLRLIFDGQLDRAHINQGEVKLPPNAKLPAGAQLQYDPLKHGTQFRISIAVQYLLRPEEVAAYHCEAPAPQDRMPICAGNGKYFHYMISLFDERFNYQSLWQPYGNRHETSSFREDIGTNAMMYGESLEALMTAVQRKSWFLRDENPYKQPGVRFRLDANLYPLIRRAILETETKQMADYARAGAGPRPLTEALPPRQAGETDDQYIGHFVIGSANIGYEVSGLSDVSFTIHEFRLVAVLHGPPNHRLVSLPSAGPSHPL